jgi:hypothetical protein
VEILTNGSTKVDGEINTLPDRESLVPLRRFLIELDSGAVLEWNSRAQMAEGDFYVGEKRYRVVTTEEYVYIGDYGTNLGREFTRYEIGGVSNIYPPPILRYLTIIESDIVEEVDGVGIIQVELPNVSLDMDNTSVEDIGLLHMRNTELEIQGIKSADGLNTLTVVVLVVLILVLINSGRNSKHVGKKNKKRI